MTRTGAKYCIKAEGKYRLSSLAIISVPNIYRRNIDNKKCVQNMEFRYHLHFPINDKSKSVLWVERNTEVETLQLWTGTEQEINCARLKAKKKLVKIGRRKMHLLLCPEWIR
jgi:hypothetical protein